MDLIPSPQAARHTDSLLHNLGGVARLLGLSRRKVDDVVSSGELPVVRIGKCVRVSDRALRAFVANLEKQGEAEAKRKAAASAKGGGAE